LVPEGRVITVDEGTSVDKLLSIIGVSSESVVVIVNGRPVTEDYRVRGGDDIIVVRVLSGGQV